MKKRFLSSNILLLIWYFLAMVGVKIGDKYLVKGAFKDEWIFMLIPVVTFFAGAFHKKNRKNTSSYMARNVVCYPVSQSRMVHTVR